MSAARYRWGAGAFAASVLVAVGMAAAAPPAYELSRQRIVVEGRAVAALVRAGDAESIYGRFTPELARGWPVSFAEYRAYGRRVARGTPVQGQFIEKEGS